MNRRNFVQSSAGALLGMAVSTRASLLTGTPRISDADRRADIPFRLSVMLWTVFRDVPFAKRLELVAQAGFRNVELVHEYDKWSEQEFSEAAAARQTLGMQFDATAGVKHGVCNPAERDAFLADVQNAVGVMKKLSCPSLIVLSGDIVPGLSRDAQHQSCIEGLRAAVKLVEGQTIDGKPIRLLLENIDGEENPKYYLTSAREGLEIVRAVDHAQVKFLYDFYHAQISEGNLIETLEKNIAYVDTVHVADVPGRHQPGTGEINYENIFRKLAELNFNGVVAMEFLPTGAPVAALRVARDLAVKAYTLQSRPSESGP